MQKFLIRQVATGYKFDLKAPNGQTIATSEVYRTRAACQKGIDSVRKNASGAKLEDQCDEQYGTLTNPKFELYADKSGEYRFRLRSRNGKTVAVSEGYTTKAACENGIESVRKNASDAKTEIEI